MGAQVTEEELRELIAEVDINQNATIEEEEFLQVCVCVLLVLGRRGEGDRFEERSKKRGYREKGRREGAAYQVREEGRGRRGGEE